MEGIGRLATPRAQRVRRSLGARVVLMLALCVLGGALARLQLLEGENLARVARDNRLRAMPVPAPRGTIYDRHGRVLAENVPGYQIMLMPGQVDSMRSEIARLRPLIGLTDEQVQRAFGRWQRQRHLPMVLLADASADAVAALTERLYDFPAVVVHEYAKRRYPSGSAIAHFIGYVNEVDEQELNELYADDPAYAPGRWVGKHGLEKQYERAIGGTPGMRFLEVDARGHIKRWLPEELGTPPVPGQDLHLYLDLDLQEFIATIFPKEFNGAIVAIEPQTGGVLAYYSHPTYDPNIWIGGISSTDYTALQNDERKPLLDRVVGSRQPAASTWKLAIAGLALDLGILDPEEYMPVSCTGGISLLGRYAGCHGVHGRQNLIEGIKNSCNVYFYQLGARIGLRRMLEHGSRLGFSDRTGVDVPHELAPTWPDIDWWRRMRGYSPPENEVMSLAIGQGPIDMTIIKLAHVYAALTAPDGRVPAPRLARNLHAAPDTFEFHTTALDRWYLEAGMRRVVGPGGTASRSRLTQWDFIGKTGTAEKPPGLDHGWFVGTGAREPGAPPEIAVTMFLERAEHGYIPSGYVAEAINFYLSRKYGRPFQPWATERHRSRLGLRVDWPALAAPVVDAPRPAPDPQRLAAPRPTAPRTWPVIRQP